MPGERTPEEAREAYQSQVPRMRNEFRRILQGVDQDCTVKGIRFKDYPALVGRAAIDEMYRRNYAARDAVKALLDSGWKPSLDKDLRGVFVSCFCDFSSHERESWSDIYQCYGQALANIGYNGQMQMFGHIQPESAFKLTLGDAQVAACKECVATLNMHITKKEDRTVNIHGPVGAVVSGDHNAVNVTQHNQEMPGVANAIRLVKDHAASLPEAEREEVLEHLAALDEEMGQETPRKNRLKVLLVSIGHALKRTAEWSGKVVIESAIEAGIKSLSGGS